MYGIVVSKSDKVGTNALPILLEKGFKKIDDFIWKKDDAILIERPEDVIYLERLDELADRYQLGYLAIISRHKATKGIKTLSVHPTGNFGEAKYGGNPGELSVTFANGMQRVWLEMQKRNPGDYSVTLEVTHHGPTQYKTPLFFVEVGPSESEWNDLNAVETLVDSILEGAKRKHKSDVAIGFGGGHYAPKFNPLEETVAFSHMCPKYNIGNVDKDKINQMVTKTWDGVDFAVIDENGIRGQDRVKIKSLLESVGLEYQMI